MSGLDFTSRWYCNQGFSFITHKNTEEYYREETKGLDRVLYSDSVHNLWDRQQPWVMSKRPLDDEDAATEGAEKVKRSKLEAFGDQDISVDASRFAYLKPFLESTSDGALQCAAHSAAVVTHAGRPTASAAISD